MQLIEKEIQIFNIYIEDENFDLNSTLTLYLMYIIKKNISLFAAKNTSSFFVERFMIFIVCLKFMQILFFLLSVQNQFH